MRFNRLLAASALALGLLVFALGVLTRRMLIAMEAGNVELIAAYGGWIVTAVVAAYAGTVGTNGVLGDLRKAWEVDNGEADETEG